MGRKSEIFLSRNIQKLWECFIPLSKQAWEYKAFRLGFGKSRKIPGWHKKEFRKAKDVAEFPPGEIQAGMSFPWGSCQEQEFLAQSGARRILEFSYSFGNSGNALSVTKELIPSKKKNFKNHWKKVRTPKFLIEMFCFPSKIHLIWNFLPT